MDFCVTVSQVKRLQKAIYLKLHSLIAIMLPLQRNIFSVHVVIFKAQDLIVVHFVARTRISETKHNDLYVQIWTAGEH